MQMAYNHSGQMWLRYNCKPTETVSVCKNFTFFPHKSQVPCREDPLLLPSRVWLANVVSIRLTSVVIRVGIDRTRKLSWNFRKCSCRHRHFRRMRFWGDSKYQRLYWLSLCDKSNMVIWPRFNGDTRSCVWNRILEKNEIVVGNYSEANFRLVCLPDLSGR